jgi:hypothetical protein
LCGHSAAGGATVARPVRAARRCALAQAVSTQITLCEYTECRVLQCCAQRDSVQGSAPGFRREAPPRPLRRCNITPSLQPHLSLIATVLRQPRDGLADLRKKRAGAHARSHAHAHRRRAQLDRSSRGNAHQRVPESVRPSLLHCGNVSIVCCGCAALYWRCRVQQAGRRLVRLCCRQHMYVCMRVCARARVCACMCVRACVCVRVRAAIPPTHASAPKMPAAQCRHGV